MTIMKLQHRVSALLLSFKSVQSWQLRDNRCRQGSKTWA